MKLRKVFACTDLMRTAAIHERGRGYLVRFYDRGPNSKGLIKTLSTPSYGVALRHSASYVYNLGERDHGYQ